VFSLRRLARPLVGAPMAGGVSTPELVAAVSEAGGLGMLPAGYLSPAEFRERLARVKELTDRPFGVNLFVPEDRQADDAVWAAYRQRLAPTAAWLGAELPARPKWHDDFFAEKLALTLRAGPALASFTFGLPPKRALDALASSGIAAMATVTSASEAAEALGRGFDTLCVQGPEAGGHRATFQAAQPPPETPLAELLAEVLAQADATVVAAGGVAGPGDVRRLLDGGAAAAQVGTAFLGAHEAGAKPAQLRALIEAPAGETVVTRAFTGRPARALANEFVRDHSAHAPALYPQVHYLTAPIRAQAARHDQPEALNCWAGTGHAAIRRAPAAEIVDWLTGAG
jgi:nitronate monooxygenase